MDILFALIFLLVLDELAGRSSAKPESIESYFFSCPSSLRFDATIKFEPRRGAA
jgi:hypothetical protein